MGLELGAKSLIKQGLACEWVGSQFLEPSPAVPQGVHCQEPGLEIESRNSEFVGCKCLNDMAKHPQAFHLVPFPTNLWKFAHIEASNAKELSSEITRKLERGPKSQAREETHSLSCLCLYISHLLRTQETPAPGHLEQEVYMWQINAHW